MDRRTFLLIAAAAVGTSGCTERSTDPGPNPSSSGRPADPDQALRQRVAESEAALIAAYRAAMADAPALAGTLEPILHQHEAHLARVAPGWTAPASVAPTPASEATSPTSPTPASTGAPGDAAEPVLTTSPGSAGTGSASAAPSADPADVLSRLAAEESAARDQRIASCDAAVEPALARALCLIGASEAQHAAVLADLAREDTP